MGELDVDAVTRFPKTKVVFFDWKKIWDLLGIEEEED